MNQRLSYCRGILCITLYYKGKLKRVAFYNVVNRVTNIITEHNTLIVTLLSMRMISRTKYHFSKNVSYYVLLSAKIFHILVIFHFETWKGALINCTTPI